MVFSSPIFLFLFLPVLLALYFVLPRRLRNSLLLAASLLFYAWGERTYVLVMLGSILFNYVLVLCEEPLHGRGWGRLVIAVAVVVNLGLLVSFKYANFLADNLNVVLGWLSLPAVCLRPVHLPIGISFFTFHALSYVVDVYRRRTPAQKNPIDFALYITLFPQLVAGPIIRYSDIAAQLARRVVTRAGFALGVRRFTVGLAKKMLIANTLGVPADAIFGFPPEGLTPGLAWFGSVCYLLQIYFDFSGYSDMAIGLAHLFGFEFKENFNYPYIAQSVTDFWRRWHISLSTWFRDYLYIPLGGNRCGRLRLYANLLTVFLLCGLWHGASWGFLLWGLFHGAFLVLERVGLEDRLRRAWRPVRHLYTLLAILVGWVFFRAPTLPAALIFLQAMAGRRGGPAFENSMLPYLTTDVVLALVAGAVAATPVVPLLGRLRDRWLAAPLGGAAPVGLTVRAGFAFAEVATCGLLLLSSAVMLATGTYNPFIYFRF